MFLPKESDFFGTALLCVAISIVSTSLIGSCFPTRKNAGPSSTPSPSIAIPAYCEAWTNGPSATPKHITTKNLFAVLVTTNLVSQPCACGFCDPVRGIRVPEHVNQIGYDLKLQVSTNYLPVVQFDGE